MFDLPSSVMEVVITFSYTIDDFDDLELLPPLTEAKPTQYSPADIGDKIAFAAGFYFGQNHDCGKDTVENFVFYLSLDLHTVIEKTIPNVIFDEGTIEHKPNSTDPEYWNSGTIKITYDRRHGRVPTF